MLQILNLVPNILLIYHYVVIIVPTKINQIHHQNMNYKLRMVVQRVLVMDAHSIFSYEHHLLVQYVIRMMEVIEHLSDHVNLVDKKFEKFLIRMYRFGLFSFPKEFSS